MAPDTEQKEGTRFWGLVGSPECAGAPALPSLLGRNHAGARKAVSGSTAPALSGR